MPLFSSFRDRMRRKASYLRPSYFVTGWEGISCLPFGELVFHNTVELLTDLNNDVTFSLLSDRGRMTFAEFDRFFKTEGETAMWRVYRYGFAVIGYKLSDDTDANGNAVQRYVTDMRLLERDEWMERQVGGDTFVSAKDDKWRVYLMKSQTYKMVAKSDYDLCHPAIEFLDNTLNASNTSVKKLGAFVVASPETPSGAPSVVKLSPEDKVDMEKDISQQYGLLSRQKQIMLLPKGMKFQTVSLTNIDNKLTERVKLNVELIADRLKVPASQIAVIDASAGKSLSNGGEVYEGDRLKYKTYERMLNKTFVTFAESLGLRVTYTIYNKPADAVTGDVTTIG